MKRRLIASTVAGLAAVATTTIGLVGPISPATAADCSNGYVALTFDDGPTTSHTTALLKALQTADAKATFFIWGQRAQQNPGLLKDEVAAGMWIANHSYTHPHLPQGTEQSMREELTRTQDVIKEITGQTPDLFRPPYGETNATLKAVEAELGLTEILWDVDSKDWNSATTEQIVQAAGTLKAGQVMLMHDGYTTSVNAVPQIVANLAARGLCPGQISAETGRAVAPVVEPTAEPTVEPTVEPTAEPTAEPTVEPTAEPTVEPTTEPEPTSPTLSIAPTTMPTTLPTTVPLITLTVPAS